MGPTELMGEGGMSRRAMFGSRKLEVSDVGRRKERVLGRDASIRTGEGVGRCTNKRREEIKQPRTTEGRKSRGRIGSRNI